MCIRDSHCSLRLHCHKIHSRCLDSCCSHSLICIHVSGYPQPLHRRGETTFHGGTRRTSSNQAHSHRANLWYPPRCNQCASIREVNRAGPCPGCLCSCLLYTSDAADERSSVDLGGRRIIKKKK